MIGAGLSSAGKLVGSTVAHALSQGLITGISGGDALSSMMAAGIGDLSGAGLGLFGNDYVTLGGSVLVGGATSSMSGGCFWDGIRDVAIAVGLNHLMHDIPEEPIGKLTKLDDKLVQKELKALGWDHGDKKFGGRNDVFL